MNTKRLKKTNDSGNSNSKSVTIAPPTVVELSEITVNYATMEKVKLILFKGTLVQQNVGMEKRLCGKSKFVEV